MEQKQTLTKESTIHEGANNIHTWRWRYDTHREKSTDTQKRRKMQERRKHTGADYD